MKIRDPLAAIIAIGAICFMADVAEAERISLGAGQKAIGACKSGGGTSWVPGKTGHTSGCLNLDGTCVVCGGVGAKYKNSCDTFRVRGRDVGPLGGRLGSGSLRRR